jgi:hypothetical protein
MVLLCFFQAYHYCIKKMYFDLPSLHAITVHGVGGIVPHNPCTPLDHHISCYMQQCNNAKTHEIRKKLYYPLETLPDIYP